MQRQRHWYRLPAAAAAAPVGTEVAIMTDELVGMVLESSAVVGSADAHLHQWEDDEILLTLFHVVDLVSGRSWSAKHHRLFHSIWPCHEEEVGGRWGKVGPKESLCRS